MGGFAYNESKRAEIFPKSSVCNNISLASLPTDISWGPSLVQTSEEKVLLCGGYNNEQKCLELKDNQWQEHSNLTSIHIELAKNCRLVT